MRQTFLIIFILTGIWGFGHAQETLNISGKVLSEAGEGIPGVNIQIKGTTQGVQTNDQGEFAMKVDGLPVTLLCSHIGFESFENTLTTPADLNNLSIVLKESVEVLTGVNVEGERQRDEVSVITLKPKSLEALPSTFGDFTAVLATLPGVVSNNELSSTYSVRGGSFDENLVYVNDIPIYRPFLISNGQQEGLSFVNSSLVESVSFSAGGWQPVYGDKLSSVLNVTYKEPKSLGGSAYISLLGAGAHIENVSKNKRINYVGGVRHKSAQYLLNTLETQGEYLPKFTDFQGYVNFKLGSASDPSKTTLGVLGSYARNRYLVEPQNRETEFGTFSQSLRLFVAFEGRELLEYDTYQGGVKLQHKFNQSVSSSLIVSGVYALEREYTDVEGGYRLCDVDKNVGSSNFNECVVIRGIGTNYDYGRNNLNAEILNVENRNEIILNESNTLGFGFGWSKQFIDDEISEFNFRDSADFVIDTETLQAKNNIESNTYTGYVQNTTDFSKSIWATYGVRLNYWDFNDQLLVSPRAQISFRPGWIKDIIFKAAAGIYQQPPFYRDMRNFEGEINQDIKSQRSVHFIAGLDYNFIWWGRPFKFIGEAYYKEISDVIAYDIDNVKVRYYANNNADAFSTGLDLRVSGEFIEGAESWFSLGILNVRENVEGDGRGYIRRPTDQRLNLGIFFQDHLPNNPTVRVSLSVLFGSGLPFGPPNDFKNRNVFSGDSYRRVDVGFSKLFYLNKAVHDEKRQLLISAEILNLIGSENAISYTWVRDVTNTQIAVPNGLSARFLNVKMSLKI